MRRASIPFIFAMALCSIPVSAAQSLWLPAIYSDHMLVQAGRKMVVWGRDSPGTPVRARIYAEPEAPTPGRLIPGRINAASFSQAGSHRSSAGTVADGNGDWSLRLNTPPAGGPYILEIAGSDKRRIKDILVGELWLASGQSNMELTTRYTTDVGTDLISAADTKLRLFLVDRAASLEPSKDVRGHWQISTPDTAADFSAVAYYFGRELRTRLKIPVGIIAAAFGGTPGEDWVPRGVLNAVEPYRTLVAGWDSEPGARDFWSKGMDFDLSLKDLRFSANTGASFDVPLVHWTHREKPGSWGISTCDNGVLDYKGLIQGSSWCLTEDDVRDVSFGAMKFSSLFQGGLAAGAAPLDIQSLDNITFRAKGKGTIALSLGPNDVLDPDAGVSSPVTLTKDWADYRINFKSLMQGAWQCPRPFEGTLIRKAAFVVQAPYWPDLGGVAYNAMIAPLTPMPLRGVLWYQGESNAGRADQYSKLLQLIVESWRLAWHTRDLAFLCVQLPGYAPYPPPEMGGFAHHSDHGRWAELREAQAETVAEMPYSELVATIDVGNRFDIHPKDKKPVGMRLALAALGRVYGKHIEYSGPRVAKARREGSKLRINMDHASGMKLIGPGTDEFEIAGKDGVYRPSLVKVDGHDLMLWCPEVTSPLYVRYGWSDDPAAELYNDAGLPAAPFVVTLK
jgi:sialate O-acetylesterase